MVKFIACADVKFTGVVIIDGNNQQTIEEDKTHGRG